jgi:hypothetical protein
VYRDLDYVKSECAQLAHQLAAVHERASERKSLR